MPSLVKKKNLTQKQISLQNDLGAKKFGFEKFRVQNNFVSEIISGQKIFAFSWFNMMND